MNTSTANPGHRASTDGAAKLSAVAFILAVGLGSLYLAIALVLGDALAGTIVTALGFGYAALAFLSDTGTDHTRLRRAVLALFKPGWRSFTAIGLVWASAAAVAAIPMLRGELSIRIVDEFRRPVASAEIWVDLGRGERPVANVNGEAELTYFTPLATSRALVRVRNAGVTTHAKHAADERGRFSPLQIAVWSGDPVLRATHLTFEGMSIDAVLRGELPPHLAQRFRNVSMVLPNDVYATARAFVRNYETSTDSAVRYLEDQVRGGRRVGTPRSDYYEEDASPVFARLLRARNVRPIYASAVMDMSDEVLGCPTVEPLRPGFRVLLTGAGEFYLGTAVKPVGALEQFLADRASHAMGEDGSYSMLVERALAPGDLSAMLESAQLIGEEEEESPEAKRLLRLLVRAGAPRGLLKGWARLSRFYMECAAQEKPVAVEFQIPAPKLRVTVLENSTDRPIRVDRFLQVVEQRNGFERQKAGGRRVERQVGNGSFYDVQPGEAIIVPREFSLQSMVSDEEIELADRTQPGAPIAMFQLLPQFGTQEGGSLATPGDDFVERPRRVSVELPRLVLPPVPEETSKVEYAEEAEAPEDHGYGAMGLPAGPVNLIGPSVAELDYFVGGVRMRARSDMRTRIAMIGETPAGSCPFVFVRYARGRQPVNLGQIIKDQIGRAAQASERVPIGRRFERVEIRELERERSYLDGARLLVASPQGVRTYNARHPLLSKDDGRYLILSPGERVELDFGYRAQPRDGPATLEINGYYVPLARQH